MVLATAVPNQKAATKIEESSPNDGRGTAVRTRVDTTVAMEFGGVVPAIGKFKK